MKLSKLGSFVLFCLFSSSVSQAQQLEELQRKEQLLLERIAKLEERLAALESRLPPVAPQPAPAVQAVAAPAPSPPAEPATLNAYFDGYYLWNTNRPAGRVNQLRAYDGTANSFSINQAGLVLEQTPAPDAGRRWGYRLDLIFGQAAETLASPVNEPRPAVYRNVFQAYGTFVAPVGKGLTVDFGKWASALGMEGTFTKDQINYSRSLIFSLMPFYHMGVRTSYAFNDRVSAGYWLVNGLNQTEDFNGFKSQLAQVVVKPWKSVAWTSQYYTGLEQPDRVPPAKGRIHILDTYAVWTPTGKLQLAGELTTFINRTEPYSPPLRASGGAAYLRYQWTPHLYLGQRFERMRDAGGVLTGNSATLYETTSTLGYRFGEGFETRLEYRRDHADRPYFITGTPDRLNKGQNTLTLGMLWWYGGKRGAW